VDPNSGHDCGNSRYLAIPWFDACLAARLPDQSHQQNCGVWALDADMAVR
jgi:hypothetical protein